MYKNNDIFGEGISKTVSAKPKKEIEPEAKKDKQTITRNKTMLNTSV